MQSSIARVALLLAFGAGCGAPDELSQTAGFSPLHRAAVEDSRRGAEEAMQAGVPVDGRDAYDRTPLHIASLAGSARVGRLLLTRGADAQARAWYDMTPLHWAALAGEADMVELLLTHGADPQARNIYGMTPLHEAKTRRVAQLLLRAGADLAAQDARGMTPLHLASSDEVARGLIDAGAEIGAPDFSGRRPLDMVVTSSKGRQRVVLYSNAPKLRLRGEAAAGVFAVRNLGSTPVSALHLRAESSCAETELTPDLVPVLHPAQMVRIEMKLHRRAETASCTGDVTLRLAEGRNSTLVGLTLPLDARPEQTPEDLGKLRVGRAEIRPAPGPLQRVAYFAAPLLLVVTWALLRARRRSRKVSSHAAPATAQSETGSESQKP